MSECKKCGEILDYPKQGYATTLNNEVVLMCEECYLKNCAVINSKYEKDENYKKESDLPQDIIERLKKINYPVDKFLREVVFDSETSLREWLHCCESNMGHCPKEHQDLSDKMTRTKGHPSLNEYEMKRIEAYLKSGLSIRGTMKAIHADGFNTSFGTIKTIKKEMQKDEQETLPANQT